MPTTDVSVTRKPGKQRYEAVLDEETVAGFLEYQETKALVVLTHTEVDTAFEGMGIGSSLARAALDDVRARGLKALVVCPFVLGWVGHHPEYADLLHNAPATPRVRADDEQPGSPDA